VPNRSKSGPEASGRCLGASPDKPYTVRGKITFALGIEAEEARYACDSVLRILDSLSTWLAVPDNPTLTVHEWEVLPEQIERSE